MQYQNIPELIDNFEKTLLAIASVIGLLAGWVKVILPILEKRVIKIVGEGFKNAGKGEINELLVELKSKVPNCQKVLVIATMNGGGVPGMVDQTFKQVLFSSAQSDHDIFGHKTSNDSSYNDLIGETIIKGYKEWTIEDMQGKKEKSYLKSLKITNGIMMHLGVCMNTLWILHIFIQMKSVFIAVDFKGDYKPTNEDWNAINTTRSKIMKLMKQKRKTCFIPSHK